MKIKLLTFVLVLTSCSVFAESDSLFKKELSIKPHDSSQSILAETLGQNKNIPSCMNVCRVERNLCYVNNYIGNCQYLFERCVSFCIFG